MDPTTAAERIKQAAAAHADTYVEVAPADLAELAASPALAPADRATWSAVAQAALRTGGTVSLHRTAHLAPLLAGAA